MENCLNLIKLDKKWNDSFAYKKILELFDKLGSKDK
jgi:hypothetical protein